MKTKVETRTCPRCHGWKNTRKVPTEPGYGNLEKWVCDYCEIAWYLQPGKRTGDFGRFISAEAAKLALESAKKLYLPHKPPPKPTSRMENRGNGRYYVKGADDKTYGYIENGIFFKPWTYGSKHKFNNLDCWALDAESFDKLIRPTCSAIIIIDKESGKRYRTTVAFFVANMGEFDWGFGRQYFMTLDKWTII